MSPTPTIRVIVRLPYNRPEEPHSEPPRVEWNPDKENILWEVMARSRAADSGGTDWKGLAAHLEVPLPYLLYRAQTRWEQDLRGLQDLKGALSPTLTQNATKNAEYFPNFLEKPSLLRRASSRLGPPRLSSSTRLSTPTGGRTRLSSLPSRAYKTPSSSVLTLRGSKKANVPLRPPSPSSSEEEGESDEEAAKAEMAERDDEEQQVLERKLQNLQIIMTNEALGLVHSPLPKEKGKEVNRGRIGLLSPRLQPQDTAPRGPLSDRSQSLSSTSSPQGSIPSMPSPPPESQRGSPINRHISPVKSTSPPAVSHRSARGQSHMRYGTLVGRRTSASEKSSNQGSSASSFSDISEASISASALESALLSNIKGGSRLSSFARSQFSGRRGVH